MTDQQPKETPIEQYMDHVACHACDKRYCKIAEQLALKALIAREQDWGFPDQETKDD